MTGAKASTVGQVIDAAISYAGHLNEKDIRTHYLHSLQDITSRVGLEDLTTAELVSLAALLIPASGRALSGRGLPDDPGTSQGKILNLVRGSDVAG